MFYGKYYKPRKITQLQSKGTSEEPLLRISFIIVPKKTDSLSGACQVYEIIVR